MTTRHYKPMITAGLLTVAISTGMLAAPATAHADIPGCQTVLWGFLGSQRRTLCDGPIAANGSWIRGRAIWTPAHQVPLTCYTSGSRYWSSTSCSGGYWVPETRQSEEYYPVTAATVLPDEPGWLGPGTLV